MLSCVNDPEYIHCIRQSGACPVFWANFANIPAISTRRHSRIRIRIYPCNRRRPLPADARTQEIGAHVLAAITALLTTWKRKESAVTAIPSRSQIILKHAPRSHHVKFPCIYPPIARRIYAPAPQRAIPPLHNIRGDAQPTFLRALSARRPTSTPLRAERRFLRTSAVSDRHARLPTRRLLRPQLDYNQPTVVQSMRIRCTSIPPHINAVGRSPYPNGSHCRSHRLIWTLQSSIP